MTTRGIDIRQASDRLVFRVSLKDSAGDKVTTGTTELRVYRVEDDGTLDVYDWTTNDFVAPGAGTPDDETTMTHRQRRDSSGADVDTGIWTAVLSTLTNFTSGQVYIAQVTNSNATPESQEREFQFGNVEGDQVSLSSTAQGNLEDAFDGTGYDVGGIDVSELNAIVDDLINDGRLDLLFDAIKAKTDQFTFTVAGNVDANITHVNNTQIQGDGTPTTNEWRKV